LGAIREFSAPSLNLFPRKSGDAMLEDSLFESQGRKKGRNPVTVFVSAAAHVATVGVLVLIPLLQTQALTIPPVDTSMFLPRIEKPQSIPVVSTRRRVQNNTSSESASFTAPAIIPPQVAFIDEPPIAPVPFLPSGRSARLLIPDVPNTAPIEPPSVVPPPPAPAPPPPPVEVRRVRISDGGQPANLIHQVKPTYPILARTTRTQGVVVLEAVIGRDGSISSLRVVSGHQLLTQAAIDAVKQWKYRPTLLNGDPVEVITTITVTFNLQ
jgi:periplasmic protein TonB